MTASGTSSAANGKAALFERIDVEIAALKTHRETLDFETIAIDRAEAGSRALFDASKSACLARRYEAEADRGFYKALKELRKVEAESAAREESAPAASQPIETADEVGSFRETAPPPSLELTRTLVNLVAGEISALERVDDRATRRTRRPKLPR